MYMFQHHRHYHHYPTATGLLLQLVVAALGNMGKLYTTVEGAAKVHVDNTISAKAALLEGLLGE